MEERNFCFKMPLTQDLLGEQGGCPQPILPFLHSSPELHRVHLIPAGSWLGLGAAELSPWPWEGQNSPSAVQCGGRMSWALQGVFSSAFISAVFTSANLCCACALPEFFLSEKQFSSLLLAFTLKTCLEGKHFWGVCIQATNPEPFCVGI